MKALEVIKILEVDYGWNSKQSGGFSDTQKMIIKDTIKAVMGAEEDGAIQQIMDLCQKYWNNYNRNKAVVYAKNTETGQCFTFTRGEYSEELIEFIEGLK